jgi:RimJ/RimL family protein N-acetyltransferase
MWPLFDLRIRHRDVLLRPVREADLPHLCDVLPPDVGHDPRLALFPSQSLLENERRLLCMGYWKALGTWDPTSWVLHLAVIHEDEIVGVQTLEAENFPALRTVDSASWLVPAARGKGIGVRMRTAALGLAFDHLGATAAISSATFANSASLGVSRRVGYVENGRTRIVDTGGDVADLQNMLLTADRWPGYDVDVTGFEPCRPWFGLDDPVTLRPTTPADIEVFYHQAADPEAIRRANVPARARDEFETHWRDRVLGDPSVLVRTILSGNETAGNVVSWWRDDRRTVGYWLGRAFWGRGIGTAALRQFLSLEQTRPLYADTDVNNLASRRLLERCGFRLIELHHEDDVDYVVLKLT